MTSHSSSLRRARPSLGTLVDIRAGDAPQHVLAEGIAAAFAAIDQVNRLMSFHSSSSDLSRLNRLAAHESVEVHAWTWQVLRAARLLWEHTGGLFDCSVAPSLVRAGFLPCTHSVTARGARMGDVHLEQRHRVRFGKPLMLDLGGIAKGFAVDRAVDALRAAGVPQGAINAGGDLRLFGDDPEAVHVRNPESPGKLLCLGSFTETAVATSAAYFAERETDGGRVTPIVDPESGVAIDSRRSVTVLAPECLYADALTKPVLLSGMTTAAFLARFSARAVVLG